MLEGTFLYWQHLVCIPKYSMFWYYVCLSYCATGCGLPSMLSWWLHLSGCKWGFFYLQGLFSFHQWEGLDWKSCWARGLHQQGVGAQDAAGWLALQVVICKVDLNEHPVGLEDFINRGFELKMLLDAWLSRWWFARLAIV